MRTKMQGFNAPTREACFKCGARELKFRMSKRDGKLYCGVCVRKLPKAHE